MAAKPIITQQELAKRLGLTQVTVSRALTGKGRMAPETRERVLKMAGDLGYRPNGMARRVQEGRYRGMALLGSADRPAFNVWDQEFHMAVGATLSERSWHLTEGWLPGVGLADPSIVANLLDQTMADVVLVHDVGDQPPMVEAVLAKYRVQTVWVNGGRKHDAVDFADAAGAGRALDHLLAQGYRKPALLLSVPPDVTDEHCSVGERSRGFSEACRKHGLKPRLIQPSQKINRIGLHDLLTGVLSAADRPDSLVCYSALMLPSLRVCTAMLGLRIGSDLGVVAIGKEADGLVDQPFTMVTQDYVALGREAVHLAWKLLETGQRQARVLIDEPLIRPGASTTR